MEQVLHQGGAGRLLLVRLSAATMCPRCATRGQAITFLLAIVDEWISHDRASSYNRIRFRDCSKRSRELLVIYTPDSRTGSWTAKASSRSSPSHLLRGSRSQHGRSMAKDGSGTTCPRHRVASSGSLQRFPNAMCDATPSGLMGLSQSPRSMRSWGFLVYITYCQPGVECGH